MKRNKVTIEGILAEIEKLNSQNPDGFAIRDMMEETNHSYDWCRRKIRELIDAERVAFNGFANKETIDGRACKVPVYKLIKKKGDK